MRIRIYKIDGFIIVYDEIRYLVIFDYWLYDEIYNMIRYSISEKSGITYSINHNFARIRTDSSNSSYRQNIDFLCFNTHSVSC